MARDPFAPVTEPSVPPWIWAVAAIFGVLIISMGAIAAVTIYKRSSTPAAVVPTPVAPKAASAPTASAGTPAAPDKAPDKARAETPDKPDEAGKGDKAERARTAHHRRASKDKDKDKDKDKGGSAPAAPAKPAAPPKKKNDMSQKEIDSLLGL